MGKEIVNQVQEVQRIPYRLNPRRNMLKHILIKLTKIKHNDVKSSKGKAASNIQCKTHMISSGPFSRHFAGQKGIAGYI